MSVRELRKFAIATLSFLSAIVGGFWSNNVDAHENKPGDYEDKVTVAGVKRAYLVHVPSSSAQGELRPVVIVFHGGLANARMSQWNARMIDKGDQENFYVVYPHGSSGVGKHLLTWNAGTCCGLAAKKNVDDIAFVRENS